MKKSLIVLSAITALTITSFASDLNEEMLNQIQTLKAQIEALEKKVEEQQKQQPVVTAIDEKRIEKIEKKLDTVSKTASAAKIQSGNDNLKWDVDFRTQVDNIQYKRHVIPMLNNSSKAKNNALMTNRLWLGMGYKADENSSFHGKLSYNKAFGDTANHSQSNTQPGYANFDWVTNENATDNTIKLKEAYWLYSNETFLGTNVPWTASVGRRPSTDGLPINLRNDQKANSPLSHVVDVEFDGFSFRFDTELATGFRGSWFKICAGRGLTNAKPRFDMSGTAYAADDTKNVDVDLLGIIAVPYDDGQYSVHMNYARAWNLIGYDQTTLNSYGAAYSSYLNSPSSTTAYDLQMTNPAFKDVGDIDYATILFKTEGIGNGISDYLDDTTAFASFAMSKTNPNALGMLGSMDSEVGTSVWLGINAPCPISPDDSRIGVEWNKGSKYWRSMTYGEDTYAGSKIATRGQAWEVYRNQKLTDALSFGVSYVYMKYDYTGSNSFFGADGTPMTMAEAQSAGKNPVESAQDIRAYMRYRF
jgi:TolA-binding protein